MAVEITPTLAACQWCAAALCPRCLGCTGCQEYARGCVCPTDEPAERTAYLIAKHQHRAHRSDCFPCSLKGSPDCEQGAALRAAANAAWKALSEADL